MIRRPILLLALTFALASCGSNDGKLKVTGLDPESGDVEGGTYVRIHGNAFITPVRSAKVYFGSRQGTVDRFASDSELIVQAPGGKAGEVVDVIVIFEPGGEIKIPKGFTFKEKNVATPTVDDLNTGEDKTKKK